MRELLAHTPYVTLPIVAMFVFLAIFLGAVALTILRGARAYDTVAKMPVEGGDA